MGYVFDSAQLRAMNKQLCSASNTLSAAVQGTFAAINAVSNSSAIQGQGATTIQNYLAQVHQTCICGPLMEALYALQSGFATYYSQYIAMEPISDAVINTDELETIKGALAGALSQFELAEKEMYSVMTQVAEVSNQKYDGLGMFIPLKIDSMSKHLSGIADQIGAIETKGSSDVQSVQDTINSISRLIYQYCTGGFQISNYNKRSLVSSDAYASLCTSMSALGAFNDELDKQSDQVNGLLANVEQQWTKREKIANTVEVGLAVFDKVATSIACKSLDPVGAAVVTSISGSLRGGIGKAVDLWANGGFATMSTKDIICDIMWDTSMGALKGTTKGFVGAITTKLQPAESVLSRFGLNLGTGFMNEIIDVPFEFIDSIYEGKGEVSFEEKWEEITSNEFTLELVGKCTIDSIFDSTIGYWGDKWGDSISKRVATETAKGTFETGWNILFDVGSQRIGDATDEFIETLFSGNGDLELNVEGAVSASCKEFLDLSDLGVQVVGSFVENGSAEVYEHSSLFDDIVVKTHERAINEQLRIDPKLQGENGPIYTHYELTMGGAEFSNDVTNPGMVFVLDHSNPIAQYMREVYREQGERVEKGVGSIVEGFAKGIKELVTAEDKENVVPTRLIRPIGCLDSIIALQQIR